MQTDACVFGGLPVSLDPAVADPVVVGPAVTDPVIAELAVIDHAVIDPTALAAYAVLDLCVRRHVDTSIQ